MQFDFVYLYPKPPYDFELNCQVFGYSKPMPEVYENRIWKRAIRLDSGKLIPVELESLGIIEDPKIEVRYLQSIDEQEKEELVKILDWLFSFCQDLTDLYNFMVNDPILKNLKEKFYGLKAGSIGTSVYESIIKSIIQQQISITVAFSIANKIVKRFRDQINIHNSVFFDFPTPKRLSGVNLEQVRQCGVSWRKAEYIQDLSTKIVNLEFNPEYLRSLSNESIVERLKKFRGIGTWTAEMVLSAGLKRKATIPADDIGVRRTFSKFYSNAKILSESKVRKIANEWKEFKKDIVYYISCIERI